MPPPPSLAAVTLVRREVDGLLMGRTRYAAYAEHGVHRHEHARLVLVLRGTFAERYGARSRRATPYLVLYRPPGEPHAERYGAEGATCISVDVAPAWAERAATALPRAAAQAAGRELAERVDELDAELSLWDASSGPAAEALALELASILAGPAAAASERGDAPRWWRRAQEVVLDGFREPLSLRRIAAEAGVHPVHLARTFRARSGRTVGAHLRELRVAWARAELLRSDAPVAAVAAAAGFADESHLGRVMKRLTGETPGALRRRRSR